MAGSATLNYLEKAHNVTEIKSCFPYEGFDTPNTLDKQQLPPYDDFYSKLKTSNPANKEYDNFRSFSILG